MSSARAFLQYFGLEVRKQTMDLPKRKAFDVVESSYRALVARQHGPSRIRVGNIELRRGHYAVKQIHSYDVYHVEDGFPVQQIGKFEVLIRAKSRKCLVILEPI